MQSAVYVEDVRLKMGIESEKMSAKRRKEQALELIDNAELLRRDGQIKAAIAMYQEATKLDPGLWRAYFELASVYRDSRMRHEELNTLRKALKIVQTDHERAATLNNLSDVLSFFGDVEQAGVCMEQAVALEPQNALCWGNLCGLLIRERDFQSAIEPLQRFLKLSGDDATYYEMLGRIEAGLGHYTEAVAAYEQSVDREPNRVWVWRELAKAYVEAGCYEDAERVCKQRLRPGLASHLILADIHCRIGSKEDAAIFTQKALETMGPPSAFEEVRWHYCNRTSHWELMEYVRDIAGKLEGVPWPHWISARLAAVMDDIDTVQEQIRKVLALDTRLRSGLEKDEFFAPSIWSTLFVNC